MKTRLWLVSAVSALVLATAAGAATTPRLSAERRALAPPAANTDAALIARGDWEALASQAGARLGETPSLRDLGLVALSERLAGRDIESHVASLMDRAASAPQEADGIAAILMLLDRNDAALDVLRTAGLDRDAFDLLTGELRIDEALALPVPETDHELALDRAHVLGWLGLKDEAMVTLDQYSTGRNAQAILPRILREQRAMDRSPQALATASGSPSVSSWPVLSALFPCRAPEASAAWTLLSRQDPKASAPEILARVADVLDPTKASTDVEFLMAQGAASTPTLSPCEQNRVLEGLAGIADLRGRKDLSLTLNRKWADLTGSPNAWMQLGERLFAHQSFLDAAVAYGKAAAGTPDELAPLYLQGVMLERGGDKSDGLALMQRAMDASGNEGAVYRLAFAVERQGDADGASALRERLVSEGAADSPIVAATAELLGSRSSCGKAFQDATRAFDRARVLALLQPSLSVERVRPLVASAQRAAFRANVADGRLEDALNLADHALEPFVSDIDTTADFVAALRQAGLTDKADDLLGRVADRVAVAADAHPASVRLANTQAWLGARTGLDLDAARVAAERAVGLAPDNAGIMDTLAEVRFQQGDVAGALEIERRAMSLVPDREYFAAQIERFTTGTPSTRVPLD